MTTTRQQRSVPPHDATCLHHGEQAYGTLYVGVTGNLVQRISIHKEALMAGFTRRYGVHRLVYYEPHELMADAMRREHNIKHWSRKWKIELIESINQSWDDLYSQIVG